MNKGSVLKTILLLNNFVETLIHLVSVCFDELKVKKNWIDAEKDCEILCDIINVFAVTFDQFNATLLNKSFHFFIENKSYFWMLVYHSFQRSIKQKICF